MKNKITAALAAALLTTGCMGLLHTSAYSADDVAAKARAYGWPESLIQQGYNMWASGNYTQEQLDQAYNSVYQYGGAVDDKVNQELGVDSTEAPTEQTSAAAGSTGSSGTTGSKQDTSTPGKCDTVTKKDGTTEDRITPEQFVGMTLDEKKSYVDSLTEESKKEFVASLTAEERNSMIKQMPLEDKADLMQEYINAAEGMGVNVTVDSMSEGNISLTLRDNDGKVIDKAAVGITIDETGISHTKPLLFAVGGTLLAALGFCGMYYYIKKTDESES